MSDTLDVIGIPEFFADGLCDYETIDGILRFVAYRQQGNQRIPVCRLAISPSGAVQVRMRAAQCFISDQEKGMERHH